MGSKGRLTIRDINKMSYVEFMKTFGNVIENCTAVSAAVLKERPFSTFHDLNKAFANFIDELPIAGKKAVLRLYPDLAGRLAMAGELSRESTKEQSAAGLDKISERERELLFIINRQYRNKFGFPFVVCGRLNKKDAILKKMELRLKNSAQEEVITGTNEVKNIAGLRLKDIIDVDSSINISHL